MRAGNNDWLKNFMAIKLPDLKLFRNERKFVLPATEEHRVLLTVKSNPACFRVAFPDRFVNNIYFDSADLINFTDAIMDSGERAKYRIRWYHEQWCSVQNPFLELKIRKNYFVKKDRYPLDPFNLKEIQSIGAARKLFKGAPIEKSLRGVLNTLKPILFNRYLRSYYQSSDGNIMLTVDRQIRVAPSGLGKAPCWKIDRHNIIVEIKYDPEFEEQAMMVMAEFPFRMTKHSKYLRGVASLFS